MRDHGCETMAGKKFTSLAPELSKRPSTGTVMISVMLILEGRFEGNEGDYQWLAARSIRGLGQNKRTVIGALEDCMTVRLLFHLLTHKTS